jgi:poly-gamma-glutamate synthesis protein (capsule biosynthesis protein)
MESAGVPREWAATDSRAGVALMTDLSSSTVARIVQRAQAVKRPGDIIVLSVHWGDNWGYGIPEVHRTFAHRVIDEGAVDLVHGHSSHHPIGIEVYGGRPILYGCGDFLNDYEGIGGEERYRPDLTLMYFPSFDRSGRLTRFLARPMRIRRLRLERTTEQDYRWLARMLTREGGALGTRAEVQPDGMLAVRWQ